MDLFEKGKKQKGMSAGGEKETPLADRMRPETLEEFVGQKHILGRIRFWDGDLTLPLFLA
jgi:replication-associated recombination protein RarA